MDLESIRKLVEFDTPTVANGLALLGVRDPTVGYTGPGIRALMPELGPRVGIAVTARMDTTTAGQTDPSHPEVFYKWLRHIVEVSGAAGEAAVPTSFGTTRSRTDPASLKIVGHGDVLEQGAGEVT